jgi:hypothetical protein
MDSVIMGAIEIKFHPSNFSRASGLTLMSVGDEYAEAM